MEDDLMDGQLGAWKGMHDLLHAAIRQAHSQAEFQATMFFGASDVLSGSPITQVLKNNVSCRDPVETMSYKSLGFVSGTLRGSHLN